MDDMNQMAGLHEKFREIFQASNPPIEKNLKIKKGLLKKSIFLAHRFDKLGQETANVLTKFLYRLGFNILEGSGYESTDIPDKVIEKVQTQDIFICLITTGDNHWILSETAYAKALNKYIILIKQDDVDFNSGIIGSDFEYLIFPVGIIEKIFTDLIYALPS